MSEMDRATWGKIAPLFDEASALSGPKRAAYLARVAAEDPSLGRVLAELLSADETDDALLDATAESHASILMGPAQDIRSAPPSIPSYTIGDELGRGGMGVVYLATRTGTDFEQKVALKLVRPDLDSDEIHQRFVRERRILAGLEHPGIARLVDGGITADGVSYFAMEYVEGTPITAYANAQRLTVDQRLRLFEAVCAAVDHAHQHLVVHRDLKPSNILVTREGHPKLLDFGIARLLESDEAEELERQGPKLTREAARLMTPEYAAPEQILGQPATTATDVYALGVILFELLCDHHPHGQDRLAALEHVLREHDSDWLPRALSRERRVRRPDGNEELITEQSISRDRRTTPRALRKRLGGDVASVVAMSLQRDPAKRYATPAALLEELRRLRRGLPVQARRPSVGYRLGKYVRRHRVGVAAAALIALSIAGGSGVSVWQARVASREAARAREVKDFLVSLFVDADPDASRGEDWTAAELLERGAARLEIQLADEPGIRAELTSSLGAIHVSRGEYEAAGTLLRESLGLREQLHGDRHSSVGEVLIPLANAEMLRGNLGTADSLLLRARSILDASSVSSQTRSELASAMGSLRRREGELDEAEQYHRVALALSRAAHGDAHPSVASDLDNLGVILAELGRVEEAVPLHREALAIRRAALGGVDTEIAGSLHNLAWALNTIGETQEAIELNREAIAMKRTLYQGRHPSLAVSLRTLGMVLRGQDELDEAEALFEEALEMNRELLGDDTEEVAGCLNELAIVAYQRQDLETAKALFSDAYDAFAAALPAGHPKTITVAGNLATLQQVTGKLAEAEISHRRILALRREALGEEHPDVAQSLNSLGVTLRRQGRWQEAIDSHRQALELYRKLFDDEQMDVLRTRGLLAAALSDAEQFEEARALYADVLVRYVEELPADHRDLADMRLGLGKLYHRMGRDEDALPLLEQAERVRRELFGDRSVPAATAMTAHGACLAALGHYANAESLLVRGHAVLAEELGADHVDTREAATALSEAQRAQSR